MKRRKKNYYSSEKSDIWTLHYKYFFFQIFIRHLKLLNFFLQIFLFYFFLLLLPSFFYCLYVGFVVFVVAGCLNLQKNYKRKREIQKKVSFFNKKPIVCPFIVILSISYEVCCKCKSIRLKYKKF